MIKFAICDDDPIMLDMIYDKILTISKENEFQCTLDKFLDPVDFKKNCSTILYDLVFLDINMSPVNGLEVAEYLNTYYINMKIVFITSYNDAVYETFRYSPLTFIRKDNFDGDIEKNINLILRKLKLEEKCINVTVDSTPRSIRIMDICYVDNVRNYLQIHLKNGAVLSLRKTLKAFIDDIDSEILVQINKGVLVNLEYIEKIGQKEISLDNEKVISVGRNYYDSFKNKFFKYSSEL